MEQNVENIFLSKKNLDFTFGVVRQNIQQRCNYDINNKQSMINAYNKMAKSVYNSLSEDDRNLSTLNTKLTDKSTDFFQQVINKKKGHNSNERSGSGVGVTSNYMPPVDINSPSYSQPNHPQISPLKQEVKLPVNNTENLQDNIQPFTLSDEFISSFGTTNDTLYNNIDSLEANDSVDTMKKLEEYTKSRDTELMSFKDEILARNDNDKILTNSDDKLANRNRDLQDIYSRNAHAEPLKLLELEKESTERIMADATNNTIANNNVPLINNTNELLNAILNYQRDNQPKYIDKTHFLSINSGDRNVQITSQNRYDFKVSIGKSDNGELGVPSKFKNVRSVEVIYAFFPEDTEIVGYDNRIHLNTLSNPYLLLHIDELSGVYSGTNSNNDRCFSHLVIDKEQSTASLSSGYTTSNINVTDDNGDASTINTFANQFERSYLRYYPSCFDSKIFYNNPLASLGSMNIRVTNPLGDSLNNHPDIITINAIAFEAAADKAIDAPSGFPRTALSDNKICKITLASYVSNRLFKIGDKIRISHIVSTNSDFQEYANRDDGHVIINLDAEVNTNTGTVANKGFINNIYIAPPGTIDYTNGNLDTSSYHETVGTLTNISGTSIKGYVINLNLQSHFIFKITTRDTNTEEVIKPLNI